MGLAIIEHPSYVSIEVPPRVSMWVCTCMLRMCAHIKCTLHQWAPGSMALCTWLCVCQWMQLTRKTTLSITQLTQYVLHGCRQPNHANDHHDYFLLNTASSFLPVCCTWEMSSIATTRYNVRTYVHMYMQTYVHKPDSNPAGQTLCLEAGTCAVWWWLHVVHKPTRLKWIALLPLLLPQFLQCVIVSRL